MKRISSIVILFFLIALQGCDKAWNNPNQSEDFKANVKFSSFPGPPKTLDPARSYSSDENVFLAQVYEPPLQYHYLKRPYVLIPLTATEIPKVIYLDQRGKKLPDNTLPENIAYSVYEIHIKPHIYYQPHPAFAKDAHNHFYYHHLKESDFKNIYSLKDFKHVGTRELIAEDYVYEIKRLADPRINSPIFGLMEKYIVGLKQYMTLLQSQIKPHSGFLDLRQFPLEGATVVDRYTYRIIVRGVYPQFIYWLAMGFFAPVPWEADVFYSQAGMNDQNINFDWYPVGTGAYMLTENNPNRQMVLERNPNFHPEFYPREGEANDKALGYLKEAGKRLPFIDKAVYSLEKESIPRWNKFLQGYYDLSTVSSDSFDQAVQIDEEGNPQLTPALKNLGVRLETSISPAIHYIGFNMLDPIIGGYTDRARKLRQAIAIAIDYEEFIAIFLNGRGLVAQSPIPPGIFGYSAGSDGIDPYVYEWKGKPERRSLEEAKRLLAEAGYPHGVNNQTGEPLILNYDAVTTSGPDEKALFDWMRKQFAKISIQLNIRATDYNRFQEKMRTGHAQIFSWGWNADYPDPENFLFLLYGPNSKVKVNGENAANYESAEFDSLFHKMKNLPNGLERQRIIQRMLEIIWQDAPWTWGYYSKDFVLSHQWNRPAKINSMVGNALKYQSLNPSLRTHLQLIWNKPIFWPIIFVIGVLIVITIPVILRYWKKQHTPFLFRKRER